MNNEEDSPSQNKERKKRMSHSNRAGGDAGMLGGIYGMAFIGAAVYFIQHAASFWLGVLGFFKALFWPAVIMYKVLELLKM